MFTWTKNGKLLKALASRFGAEWSEYSKHWVFSKESPSEIIERLRSLERKLELVYTYEGHYDMEQKIMTPPEPNYTPFYSPVIKVKDEKTILVVP